MELITLLRRLNRWHKIKYAFSCLNSTIFHLLTRSLKGHPHLIQQSSQTEYNEKYAECGVRGSRSSEENKYATYRTIKSYAGLHCYDINLSKLLPI